MNTTAARNTAPEAKKVPDLYEHYTLCSECNEVFLYDADVANPELCDRCAPYVIEFELAESV